MQTVVRYSFDMPKVLLDKVRTLSFHRKLENHAIRTQRAILIELLQKGLMFAHDELPTDESTPTL